MQGYDRNQNVVDTFVGIYQELIAAGYTEDKAQAEAHDRVELASEVIEEVLAVLRNDGWYVGVRHVVPVNVIENYDMLLESSLKKILWDLGMDINNMPYRQSEGVYVAFNGRQETGEYIEGSERIDDDWIKSGYSSPGADLEHAERKHGKAHRRDLERMGRT